MSELDALCAKRLAPYKRPRRLIVVDALPRNAMEKIDKKQLRAELWAGHDWMIGGR